MFKSKSKISLYEKEYVLHYNYVGKTSYFQVKRFQNVLDLYKFLYENLTNDEILDSIIEVSFSHFDDLYKVYDHNNDLIGFKSDYFNFISEDQNEK